MWRVGLCFRSPAAHRVRNLREFPLPSSRADTRAGALGAPALPSLESEHLVGLGAQPRHVGRGGPGAPDHGQTLFCRPTGDGATLSDVDGDPVILKLAQELAHRGHADPLHSLGVVPDHQIRSVAREDHGHLLADLERAVGSDVQRDRSQGRVVHPLGDYVQKLYLAFLLSLLWAL
jgi:hypothetical protein